MRAEEQEQRRLLSGELSKGSSQAQSGWISNQDDDSPGAHPVFTPGRHSPPQDTSSQLSAQVPKEDYTMDDSSLLKARRVSIPIASPYLMKDDYDEGTSLAKTGKGTFKLCVSIALVVCGILALASSFSPVSFFVASGPTKVEQMEEIILNAFGREDYFDSEPKRKALRWILYEDPLEDLTMNFDSESDATRLVQRFALVAFYFQTSHQKGWKDCGPPEATQSNMCFHRGSVMFDRTERQAIRWLSDTHECQWMGIVCEGSSKTVSTIMISNNNITGHIPSELSKLSKLKVLDLAENNLSGELPLWIDQIPSLGSVVLSRNALVGRLPPSYFSSSSLQRLVLYENLITGPIPPQPFGGSTLALSRTLLTGPIPEDIFSSTRLQWFVLADTHLTGTISTRVGELSSLQNLGLGGSNSIHGPLPSELGNLRKLQELFIKSTKISGNIPEELYGLTSLELLDLSNNRISGTLSSRLGLLTKLRALNLIDDRISGSLPKEVQKLTNIVELHINGNMNLTGSIPMEFCSQKYQRSEVVADCTPMASTGLAAIVCPTRCCNSCCDAETNICQHN